jgi:hypothetical protein
MLLFMLIFGFIMLILDNRDKIGTKMIISSIFLFILLLLILILGLGLDDTP